MTHPLVETVARAMDPQAWEPKPRTARWALRHDRREASLVAAIAALNSILSNGYAIVPVEDTARLERVAEELWQAESVRATDCPRRTAWSEESEKTREKWRFMARAADRAMLSSAPKVVG